MPQLDNANRWMGCPQGKVMRKSCDVTFGCREPGITETIITCKTGIRYNGIGHNGNRYIKTGIRYNAIRDNGIRYNGEQESVITLKWAIWNQV